MPSFVLDNATVSPQVVKIVLPYSPLSYKFIWLHSADGLLTIEDAFLFLHPTPILNDWAITIKSQWRRIFATEDLLGSFALTSNGRTHL